MIDAVKVEYYGSLVPVSQVANISTPDAKTITIQPWEKNLFQAIEKGIIIKTGNKYSTNDGLDLCENSQIPTFENAITYIDNPKHQDVRSFIEAKMLGNKK